MYFIDIKEVESTMHKSSQPTSKSGEPIHVERPLMLCITRLTQTYGPLTPEVYGSSLDGCTPIAHSSLRTLSVRSPNGLSLE